MRTTAKRRRAAAGKGRLVRLHHPAVDPEPDRHQCRRPDAGRDRCGALCARRSRSACSSSAGSGRRTSTSTAASATPTCRSARSPIPARGYDATGKGVLLGAYVFGAQRLRIHARCRPQERVARAVEYGAQIHPQYASEFENGISVAWHRVPGTLGCYGNWTDAAREQHYDNSVPDRRAHRAGRRARLLYPGVAGRRHPFLARRHPAAACARHRLMARAT